jgi:hypothetical protein
MSKKQKIRRRISSPVTERSSEPRPASVPPTRSEKGSGSALILFDKRTKIFLFSILALYFVLSTLKIHTSNIANWDIFFGKEKSESVIAGKPRFIRMDEWMITSTGAIGQYYAGMPIHNATMGDGNAPVVWNMPVKDISTVLRPYLWPYFVFDVERAFAFSWNFNVFFFIGSMFLLLMLLTRNNFWLSIVGTAFIFLSGGIQWWSYFISNHMLYLNGMFISFAYILYDKRKWVAITSCIILVLSIYGFIFNLYPPFELPLLYLYFFLFIGFLFQQKNFKSIRENWLFKSITLGISLIILGVFTYHYYHLVKDTYTMVLNTVYPGRRFSTGGDLIEGKVFAEFFGMFMTDTHTPRQWQNVCEASGFIMFFPIIFYAMGYYFFKTRRIDPLQLATSVFIIIGLIYVTVGFPVFLSKITLFSMSPDFRTLPIVGLGNCFLLILFLSSQITELKKEKISWIEFGILAVATFIFMRIVSSQINKATANYFTDNEVNIATALIVITYLLIRYKDFKFAKPALYSMLMIMTISNLNINPLTKGLAPVLENSLVVDSKEIHDKDPDARWVLYGNSRLTHLLKANGINVFNSVKFVPPLKDMKILDPGGKMDTLYNRYAWMTMQMYINWQDTVFFQRPNNDGYVIFMDPCSPRFKQLNVKYVVFGYKPQDAEIRCMTKLKENDGIYIYKRNDQ